MFATGNSKDGQYDQLLEQIGCSVRVAWATTANLLLTIARNPTMIFWLDNNQEPRPRRQRDWVARLLELFSMGVGAYTEKDVREASRAFTGWTFETKIPRLPYGRFPGSSSTPGNHDDGEKSFSPPRPFRREDIIDIVVEQPACARFVWASVQFLRRRRGQVPAWSIEPPRDQKAIDASDGNVPSVTFRHPVPSSCAVNRASSECPFQPPEVPGRGGVGSLRLVGAMSYATRIRRPVDGSPPTWVRTCPIPGASGMAYG